MALPVRLFAELALKSSTRCPRRTRGAMLNVRRDPDCFPGQSKDKVAARYLAVRCFCLASARRSFFFRRFARFLALSLPLLCPIGFKTHLLARSRHVVVSTKTESKLAADSASVLVVLRSRSFWTSHRTKPRPASALLRRSMRYWRGRVLN